MTGYCSGPFYARVCTIVCSTQAAAAAVGSDDAESADVIDIGLALESDAATIQVWRQSTL